MISFTDKINEFLKYCKDNNIDIYLVGGAIRDYLLNKDSYDLDFALCSDYDDALDKLSKKYHCKGSDKYHWIKMTIDKYNIEITHARIEDKYLDYRHPSKIEFCNDIEVDSKRRDFTINALYYKDGKIYDFYNGKKAIKDKVLKVIGDTYTRFNEDPLRILRMIRFACDGFKIANEDKRIILNSGSLLKKLKIDTFNSEFNKILLTKNIVIIEEYKSLFEEYLNLKFEKISRLAKLTTLEEIKTYLGIKNKSVLFKYKDMEIKNDEVYLTKLIYKLGKDIVFKLINYYDKIHESDLISEYYKIIKNRYYSKKQLDISYDDLIKLIAKKELLSYYIDVISYAIIEGKIKNKKDEIIKYAMENKK